MFGQVACLARVHVIFTSNTYYFPKQH